MTEEIKCRGKRVDNGEWVYGYYFEGFTGISYILVMHDHILNVTEYYEVDSDTVEKYTGLKDKNYKNIYEGDIVEIDKCKYSIVFEIGSFMLVGCSNICMYDKFQDCWNDDVYPLSQYYWHCDDEQDTLSECEVVDNIHDSELSKLTE